MIFKAIKLDNITYRVSIIRMKRGPRIWPRMPNFKDWEEEESVNQFEKDP